MDNCEEWMHMKYIVWKEWISGSYPSFPAIWRWQGFCAQRKELDEGQSGISRTPRAVFGWADQRQPERHLELQSPASHHEQHRLPSCQLPRSRNTIRSSALEAGRSYKCEWTELQATRWGRASPGLLQPKRRKREATGQKECNAETVESSNTGAKSCPQQMEEGKDEKKKRELPFAAQG